MDASKNEIQQAIDDAIENAGQRFGKSFKIELLKIIALQKMLAAETPKSRLIPLGKWNDYHDYPTIGALRQYRHYNTDNFNDVLVKSGINNGRILIDENKLLAWLENRGGI